MTEFGCKTAIGLPSSEHSRMERFSGILPAEDRTEFVANSVEVSRLDPSVITQSIFVTTVRERRKPELLVLRQGSEYSRSLTDNGNTLFCCQFFRSFPTEDVCRVAAILTHMFGHVLHNSQDGYLHLTKHLDTPSGVEQRYGLRCGNDYCTVDGDILSD